MKKINCVRQNCGLTVLLSTRACTGQWSQRTLRKVFLFTFPAVMIYVSSHLFTPDYLIFTPADHVVQHDAHPTLVPNLIFAAIQYKCHWFCINHQVSLNYLIIVVYFHRNLLIQCNNFNINGLREASKYPPEPLPVVVAGVSQHLLLIRHHLSL